MVATLLCSIAVRAEGATALPQMSTDLENPVYYTISNTRSTSGKYLYYAGDNVGLRDANDITLASLFYFTGTAEACYIHNAATTKKVASVTSWTDAGIEWTIGVTPYGDGTTGLCICPKGNTQGWEYWNEFTYNDAYTTYAANDAGSVFVIEPYTGAYPPEVPEVKPSISSLADADPTKCYTINTAGRGAWTVSADGTMFSSTGYEGFDIDPADTRQQFAILSLNDEDYYLYSVSAKKFIKQGRTLVAGIADAIEFVDASVVGEGRVMVYFKDFGGSYVNVNEREGLVINSWSTIDAGNAVLISEAGDFDAGEALAMLLTGEQMELEALKTQVKELVAAHAGNHSSVPAIGQYSTSAYEALAAVADDENLTKEELEEAIAAFEAAKCLPVFTIDGVYRYAAGMSIYENVDGSLLWKETDRTDESMLWVFDMNETVVGVTDKVVVKNLATRNLFWGASFVQVTETSEGIADDGLFLFYTEGVGYPVHADEGRKSVVRWNDQSANSASAWKFTFVGTTYEILDLPVGPETPSGPVTSLSDADPTKCYAVSTTTRGAWAVDAEGTVFSATGAMGLDVDAADAHQQFAILSANDEDYYLYSVSAGKFVKSDGSLVSFVGDAIEFADASSMGEGRVQVRFKDIAKGYINLNNYGQMTIDGWNTVDEGNAVLIAEAGDFDAAEAMAILADPEGARKTYLVAQAQELLAANADNHSSQPTLGQYGTSAYEDLSAIVGSDTATAASVEHFIAAFEASKCLPVFTIDGVNDYAAGMSIYDDGGQYPRWKATDSSDETMLWAFDMTDTIVGVTDKVVIRNLATGNLFMEVFYDVAYIRIAETTENIADDGLFLMFREEDTEFAIWASQSGVTLPSQGIFSASSTSAWKFTYVGTTYGPDYELPSTPGNDEDYDLTGGSWGDATDNIVNADLSSKEGWTVTGLEYDNKFDVSLKAAEFYAGWNSLARTEGYLKQEVTLPAGIYRLTGKAFFRQGENPQDNPSKSLGYLIAGDNKVLVKTLGSANGTADEFPAGADALYADETFDNVLEFTLTEETTLNIGYETTFDVIRSWFIVGALTLEKKITLKDNFMAQAEAFLAFGQNNMTMYSLNAVQEKWSEVMAVVDPLNYAISEGEKVLKTDVEAAMELMATSMAEMKPVLEYYEGTFASTKLAMYDIQDNSTANSDEVRTAFEDALTAALNVYSVTTVAELEAKVAEMEAARQAYVLNAVPAEGFSFDYTFLVVNPNMDGETTGNIVDGWEGGWTYQSGSYTNGDAVLNKFQEKWVPYTGGLGSTSAYQTIGNLPRGIYSVTATVNATRQHATDEKAAATGVYLFAGDNSVAVATYDGVPEIFTVESAAVTTGELTIGVKCVNSGANWVGFDNVKLSYVGALPDTPVVPDTTVTEAYNWAGIYTVRAEEFEVLSDDFIGYQQFAMEVVYYQETDRYVITEIVGYGVIEPNDDGGIQLTPSTDDPSKAVIDPGEGAYLTFYREDRGCLRLTDTNLTNAPLTITRLEDGTFTISDFCVSNVIHGTDSTGAVETPAAYYRDVTAVEYTKYAIMPINYYSGLSGWITGATMYDEDNRIVGYTSPLYRFEDKVETFRMTVNWNGRGDKYFCLSELEFYDSDGNRIELTEENVTSNADHNTLNPNHLDGGGIPALFDGSTQTYFHSAWENMPAGDHYLQITLPDGGYDAFSFRMLSRAYSVENGNIIGQEQTFPAVMVIDIADTPHRDALEVLLNRAKGYNPYSGSELGYYVEDFSYLLDAIAEAEALLLGEPSEAECEAMVAELSQAVEQFESSDKTFRLPEPGKAYRIVSALPAFYELQSVEKAITINASDNTLWWGDLCPDSLQQEFVFEPVLGDSGVHLSWNMDINLGNGTTVSETQYFYNLKNVATGLYASYNDSAKFHLDEQPCTVYLTCLGIGQFGLKFRVENEYGGGNIYTVHAGDHNEGVPSDSIGDYGGVFGISSGIVSWYGGLDTPSAWYIREYPVQTDTVPSLQLVGVTPDGETSESWVRALTLSFNKEVYVWSLDFDVKGMNTGEEFYINSHHIGENSDGGFDLTLYLGDANDGWTKMITVPDTYTYTIPAGAIKSVDGEDLPETTITFTVDGTFPVVSYSPVETTSLEQIELTFDKVIEDMTIYYDWWICNEEGDAVAYVDWGSGRGSKTVTLGLNTPITTPGIYSLRIFAGAFTAANNMPNMPANLTFTVAEDTPAISTDYVMAAQDVKTRVQSQVTLPIEMDNAGEVTAFQFDLYLPEGVAVSYTTEDGEVLYDIELNDDRAKSSHILAAEPQANGSLRIVAYSTSNAAFAGNSGLLVNVGLSVDDIAEGDYQIVMRNIRMVTTDETEKFGADCTVTLTVENLLLGDVNNDGEFSMLDVVMMVNAVLEIEQTNFNAAAADLNGDGVISMVDVVGVLRLVLTGGEAMAPARAARGAEVMPELSAGEFAIMGNGRVMLPVALNNREVYSAFQLDVVLPVGVELAEATLTGRAKASHTIAWNTLADGSVRVVAYAMDNAAFRDNEGALLNLVLNTSDALSADAMLAVTDGLFATMGGTEHRAADLDVRMRSHTTNVDEAYAVGFQVYGVKGAIEVACGAETVLSIYAVNGKLVQQVVANAGKTRIELPAGVYVVNGDKIIVK